MRTYRLRTVGSRPSADFISRDALASGSCWEILIRRSRYEKMSVLRLAIRNSSANFISPVCSLDQCRRVAVEESGFAAPSATAILEAAVTLVDDRRIS